MRLRRIPLLIEAAPVGTPTPREPRTRPRRKSEPFVYDPDRHIFVVKLDGPSRGRLLGNVSAHHDNPNADHVTIHAPGTRLSPNEISRMRRNIGKQITFHGTHHAANADTQAVRVRGLDHLSAKPNKHITVSNRHGVPAKVSNDLLAIERGERLKDWIPLSGTIELVDSYARKK